MQDGKSYPFVQKCPPTTGTSLCILWQQPWHKTCFFPRMTHHGLALLVFCFLLQFPLLSAQAGNEREVLLTPQTLVVPPLTKLEITKHMPKFSRHTEKRPVLMTTAAFVPTARPPKLQTIFSKSLWNKNNIPKRESVLPAEIFFWFQLNFNDNYFKDLASDYSLYFRNFLRAHADNKSMATISSSTSQPLKAVTHPNIPANPMGHENSAAPTSNADIFLFSEPALPPKLQPPANLGLGMFGLLGVGCASATNEMPINDCSNLAVKGYDLSQETLDALMPILQDNFDFFRSLLGESVL